MKRINYILAFFILFTLVGCSPEEKNLFDGSSANRIEASLTHVNEVLLGAKNGWLMQYYPATGQKYGGYNLFLSFSEDGKVTAASDVAGIGQRATSLYSLKQSAGAVLSFDTYNSVIHFFASPDSGVGGIGSGMEGDYDFTVMEECTSEQVVLKGTKSGSLAVMTPIAEGTNWDEYIEKIFDMNDVMQEYPAFIFEDGDYSQDLTVSWNRLVITQRDGDNLVYTYAPFVLTTDGLEFYKPFTLNGKTFSSLTYKDEGEDSYLYSAEYPSVHFMPDYPLNAMLVNNVWYLSFSGLGPIGKNFWQEIIDAKSPIGAEKVEYVGFEPYGEGVLDYVWYTQETGFGFSDALMYYELSGKDKIIMEYSGYMGGDYRSFIPDGYATWWSIMLFMSRRQTYTITAVDNPKRPSKIKLTQDDRPTNTIILSREAIQYPFIN
ncbi:MAG: DUF4302 domain-containing protein [Bacteroides nordii]|jgi:hypothetical protein